MPAAGPRPTRRSWFKYATSEDSPLGPAARAALQLRFLVAANGGGGGPDAAAAADAGAAAAGADAAAAASAVDAALAAEQDQHGDLLLAGAPEGYEHLWRKVGPSTGAPALLAAYFSTQSAQTHRCRMNHSS